MRCETCQGDGYDAREPCPECNGSGITSCCEGACGGPGEVTNGVAEAIRESYEQQPDYYVVHGSSDERAIGYGVDGNGNRFNVYFTATGQWTTKPPAPTKRELAWKRELARHGVEVWL